MLCLVVKKSCSILEGNILMVNIDKYWCGTRGLKRYGSLHGRPIDPLIDQWVGTSIVLYFLEACGQPIDLLLVDLTDL